MSITITNTYGQQHQTSPDSPTHVIGATRYRLPLVAFIAPGNPGYEDMIKYLTDGPQNLHTRPEGYGLIFLESEEHSATYFGSIAQVQQYQRDNVDGTATFDQSLGFTVAQWPHGKGWDEFLPRVFWNRADLGAIADGVGIVTAFAHNAIPGAEVIVYEYEGRWSRGGDVTKMVTYHCTGCHKDTVHDSGHNHANTGPHDRRWAARQAREHITQAIRHGVGSEKQLCRPGSGDEMLRVVNAVAKDKLGLSHNPHPATEDAYCAAKGPCSIIREIRAGVRPSIYPAR